jgi:hypothetical protein
MQAITRHVVPGDKSVDSTLSLAIQYSFGTSMASSMIVDYATTGKCPEPGGKAGKGCHWAKANSVAATFPSRTMHRYGAQLATHFYSVELPLVPTNVQLYGAVYQTSCIVCFSIAESPSRMPWLSQEFYPLPEEDLVSFTFGNRSYDDDKPVNLCLFNRRTIC